MFDFLEKVMMKPKIVCYYGGWAVYRPKPASFNVTDIDPHACTHVIYTFAGLDDQTFKIMSLDPQVDINEGKLTKYTTKLPIFWFRNQQEGTNKPLN